MDDAERTRLLMERVVTELDHVAEEIALLRDTARFRQRHPTYVLTDLPDYEALDRRRRRAWKIVADRWDDTLTVFREPSLRGLMAHWLVKLAAWVRH